VERRRAEEKARRRKEAAASGAASVPAPPPSAAAAAAASPPPDAAAAASGKENGGAAAASAKRPRSGTAAAPKSAGRAAAAAPLAVAASSQLAVWKRKKIQNLTFSFPFNVFWFVFVIRKRLLLHTQTLLQCPLNEPKKTEKKRRRETRKHTNSFRKRAPLLPAAPFFVQPTAELAESQIPTLLPGDRRVHFIGQQERGHHPELVRKREKERGRERGKRGRRERKRWTKRECFWTGTQKETSFFSFPPLTKNEKTSFFPPYPEDEPCDLVERPVRRRVGGEGALFFFFFGLRWRWRKRLKVRKKLVSLILHSIRRIGIEDGLCFPFALTVATEERL
jgi:hypothetical protein